MDEKDPYQWNKRIDRRLGYSIMAVIALAVSAGIFFSIYNLKNLEKVRIISFDTVGNLRIDDPVYVRGIQIGKIIKIEFRQQTVLVYFSLNKPIRLHQGYHANNLDINIMGDRKVDINSGDTTKPPIPEKDTIAGTFIPGVSEGIGLAWKLHNIIDSLTLISSQLLSGSSGRASLISRMNGIIASTDSACNLLLRIVSLVNNRLPQTLSSADAALKRIALFSGAVDSLAPRELSQWGNHIGRIGEKLDTLQAMVLSVLDLAVTFENSTDLKKKETVLTITTKATALYQAIIELKKKLAQFKGIIIKK